ncbi:MAG: hypothetical protein WCJ71_10735 [Candidatus Omnitrophota bacterium]
MKIKAKVFLAITLLSLFCAASLKAEPISSVSSLMDEPASLFDIGMMRMRDFNKTDWIPTLMNELKGMNLKLQDPGAGGVVYSFEENTITITVMLLGEPDEKTCANILKKYKDIIAPPTLSSSSERNTLVITSCFDHINYSVGRLPKNSGDDLLKIIRVTVGIGEKEGISNGKTLYCTSNLFEDTPSFKKYGF